jgi:hypothetical protein
MTATKPLATRARLLLDRLGQAREQQQDAEARNAVERALARARRSAEALAEIARWGPALHNHGVVLPTISKSMLTDVTGARTTLRKTATTIAAAETSKIADRVGARSVDQALAIGEKLVKSHVTELNKSVDQRRIELLPNGIDRPVVSFPGVSDSLVVGLQNIQRRLHAKVEGLTVEQLAQRLDRIIELVEQWTKDRLRLDDALQNHDPEVKEFLRLAATDEGAPWHLITPRVQKWLTEPEHAAALRVVLRP